MCTQLHNLLDRTRPVLGIVALAGLLSYAPVAAQAQDANKPADKPEITAQDASVTSKTGDEGTSLVIEAHGVLPKLDPIYTAEDRSSVAIDRKEIRLNSAVGIEIIQGEPEKLELGVAGEGEVASVTGEHIESWSIRHEGANRFLVLNLKKDAPDRIKVAVTGRLKDVKLPRDVALLHLVRGNALVFDSVVDVRSSPAVRAKLLAAAGYSPLKRDAPGQFAFRASAGGEIKFGLNVSGAVPGNVDFKGMELRGSVDDKTRSATFRLTGSAEVGEKDVKALVLHGPVAVSELPAAAGYRLRLKSVTPASAEYELVFDEPGTYPINIAFSASASPGKEWTSFGFFVHTGAVVPVYLTGLDVKTTEFWNGSSFVPEPAQAEWRGFLPANGNLNAQWKESRKAGKGKLFFTTTALNEVRVGAGLMRQTDAITYKVLQGTLEKLDFKLAGPGEVLSVTGDKVLGWEVAGKGDPRTLSVTFREPVKDSTKVEIQTQTPLAAFPVTETPLQLTPQGPVRHSGHIRLTNDGAVRIETLGLKGLAQLSPAQFPAKEIKARQVFVYRFPSADYGFDVRADLIQPEVSVSQILVYQLGDTDRTIMADVELDIREAPLRDWDLKVPEDYSVVSVTGKPVGDYVLGSQVENDAQRNLKIIFDGEITGRQLIHLHLEKNTPAKGGVWTLPALGFPGAKTVRGDLALAGTPGFRITTQKVDNLAEKPISLFPKQVKFLQQAFKIRDGGWKADMKIEALPQSIEADAYHLYSLKDGTAYGSVVLNYFVTGAPVGEWKIHVPEDLENVSVEGKDVRTWRRDGTELSVNLHQPVIGTYTLLVTYEEGVGPRGGSIRPGRVAPAGVRGERGFVQVVSPVQVDLTTSKVTENMLKIDALELPAEFRLLSSAPSLATYQFTTRPFEIAFDVKWFAPGETVGQVVEFVEANSRVSRDGELVTDLNYYVKSRGRSALRMTLPDETRLWEVRVGGQAVTARNDNGATLIPLPAGAEVNTPVEVSLRLGKPTVKKTLPRLALPVLNVPILKTEWSLQGDEGRILQPSSGTVEFPSAPRRGNGLDWIAAHGIVGAIIALVLIILGRVWSGRPHLFRFAALIALVLAAVACAVLAVQAGDEPTPKFEELRLNLPIVPPGGNVSLDVKNVTQFWAGFSLFGVILGIAGIALLASAFIRESETSWASRAAGVLLIAAGLLMQPGGAVWFFWITAGLIILILCIPVILTCWRELKARPAAAAATATATATATADAASDAASDAAASAEAPPAPEDDKPSPPPPAAPTALIAIGASLFLLGLGGQPAEARTAPVPPAIPEGFAAADRIEQAWTITKKNRLSATGTADFSGKPGERFVLLRTPAVLTKFNGAGLRIAKESIPKYGLSYVVTIADEALAKTVRRTAKFEYRMEFANPAEGFALPTGPAAVQSVKAAYEVSGWEFHSSAAALIRPEAGAKGSAAALLLKPLANARIQIRPKSRNIESETTNYYAEVDNLFLPSLGVVDGIHRIRIRPSQGKVSNLELEVPTGFMVSDVTGPVGNWQFDADKRRVSAVLQPSQAGEFYVIVATQRALPTLPAAAPMAPLRVIGAAGEVGQMALAFGDDAQPEKVDVTNLSPVNLSDFDVNLIPQAVRKSTTLHKVYRYGKGQSSMEATIAPVAPEVRAHARQILSLGDERVLLSVDITAGITRAGLFKLSFPLPAGLEVETLSGPALNHWAEVEEKEKKEIVLHLNGKTIGPQKFALTLTGPAPGVAKNWETPRFALNEAKRQTGELIVRSTTGIRLRTVTRKNVSEVDPRTLGAAEKGSLAYRLLQKDWDLKLDIEKLDPWVTGQILHEVALREGQTRTTIHARMNVENASIRSLIAALPLTGPEEAKTVRVTGPAVSDVVVLDEAKGIWEIQLKRRVVGRLDFKIEYEWTGDRKDGRDRVPVVAFPGVRQLGYFAVLRTTERLQVSVEGMPKGWQRADWSTLPKPLREAGDRTMPNLTLRAVDPESALAVGVRRHEVADSLKLRVSRGALTTVVSPKGDFLTSVELDISVIQRSSLRVTLPSAAILYNIFVNGESTQSVMLTDDGKKKAKFLTYQFYILPGADDRNAKVKFTYSLPGKKIRSLRLASPRLNVPLENIQWQVVLPEGFTAVSHDGDLELVQSETRAGFGKESYLRSVQQGRRQQAQEAEAMLDKANVYLQQGEQTKARIALKSAANNYALDAASNEDARVQLRELQTQQAIVGLNTRRQRMYMDNKAGEGAFEKNAQLEQGALKNPILQQGVIRFRPQEMSQLLQGNTSEDNQVLQRIAARLVKHQRASEPAPQAITVTLPGEGNVYTLKRTVQVNEDDPIKLRMRTRREGRVGGGLTLIALLLMAALTTACLAGVRKREQNAS